MNLLKYASIGVVILFAAVFLSGSLAFAESHTNQLSLLSGSSVEVSCLDGQEPLSGTSGLSVLVECPELGENTPTPEDTATPTDTPTPTTEPTATDEPTATPTEEPTATPEPSGHDGTTWHPLTEEFGHTHNSDPSGSALYGLFIDTFGQEISYPWQTPNENELKHEAYKYASWPTHEAAPGECVKYLSPTNQLEQTYCVTDFLLEYHGSTAFGMGTRFHSFAGCFALDPDPNVSGDEGRACFGGWNDYLKVELPYKDSDGDLVVLEPLEPRERDILYGLLQSPYLAHLSYEACATNPNLIRTVEDDLGIGRITHQWNNGNTSIFGQAVQFAFTGRDAWGGVCPDDPTQIIFPEDMGLTNPGSLDNSQARVYQVDVFVPNVNGDGSRVQLQGFTDRMGNLDSTCSVVSADCVPAFIDALPGSYRFRIPIGDANFDQSEFDVYYDFDLDRPEWIRFPN